MSPNADPERFRQQLDLTYDTATQARIWGRVLDQIDLDGPGALSAPGAAPAAGMPSPGPHGRLAEYPVGPRETAPRARTRRIVAVAALAAAVLAIGIGALQLRSGRDQGPLAMLSSAAGSAPKTALPTVVTITDTVIGPNVNSTVALKTTTDGQVTVVRSDDSGIPIANRPVVWLAPSDVSDLPADPSKLLAEVARRISASPSDTATAASLAQLSAVPYVDPSVRAAAITALGNLGGVQAATPIGGAPSGTLVAGPGWWATIDAGSGAATGFGWSASGGATPDTWRTWTLDAS